jgi:hypothetical protein
MRLSVHQVPKLFSLAAAVSGGHTGALVCCLVLWLVSWDASFSWGLLAGGIRSEHGSSLASAVCARSCLFSRPHLDGVQCTLAILQWQCGKQLPWCACGAHACSGAELLWPGFAARATACFVGCSCAVWFAIFLWHFLAQADVKFLP